MKTKRQECSICGKKYDGFGNNAEPINSGRCCDMCNFLVIIARLKIMSNNSNKKLRSTSGKKVKEHEKMHRLSK